MLIYVRRVSPALQDGIVWCVRLRGLFTRLLSPDRVICPLIAQHLWAASNRPWKVPRNPPNPFQLTCYIPIYEDIVIPGGHLRQS